MASRVDLRVASCVASVGDRLGGPLDGVVDDLQLVASALRPTEQRLSCAIEKAVDIGPAIDDPADRQVLADDGPDEGQRAGEALRKRA